MMSLSMHQFFMLKHFAIGWKFKQINNKPASWCSYWSLRRRGLIGPDSVVTKLGYEVLAKEMKLAEKRKAKNARKKGQSYSADQSDITRRAGRVNDTGNFGADSASGQVSREQDSAIYA